MDFAPPRFKSSYVGRDERLAILLCRQEMQMVPVVAITNRTV